MTPEEHKQRHIELHKALDELLADYVACHPNVPSLLTMPLMDLIEWSSKQIEDPDTPRVPYSHH